MFGVGRICCHECARTGGFGVLVLRTGSSTQGHRPIRIGPCNPAQCNKSCATTPSHHACAYRQRYGSSAQSAETHLRTTPTRCPEDTTGTHCPDRYTHAHVTRAGSAEIMLCCETGKFIREKADERSCVRTSAGHCTHSMKSTGTVLYMCTSIFKGAMLEDLDLSSPACICQLVLSARAEHTVNWSQVCISKSVLGRFEAPSGLPPNS